jgi:hypothetical protein
MACMSGARGTLPEDSRAERAKRGGNPISPRRAVLAISRFQRHGLWRWRTFSASCSMLHTNTAIVNWRYRVLLLTTPVVDGTVVEEALAYSLSFFVRGHAK